MEQQILNAVEWLKSQDIKGCITGSCLLGYFDGQDVDLFVYDEKSFNKILFAMYYNPLFTILDPLEKWKFEQYINKEGAGYKKLGLVTIKFYYNTCVPVNIILKKNNSNIFEILSSFDMDIISKGYDIQTKKYLDLSENLPDKQATWNKWNNAFYNPEIWQVSRLLRQLQRVFKYHDRGYNTDALVIKYLELIDGILEYQSIFNSVNYNDKLDTLKLQLETVKEFCTTWLATHSIDEEELELLSKIIKTI